MLIIYLYIFCYLQAPGQCGQMKAWDHSDLKISVSSCQETWALTATWMAQQARRTLWFTEQFLMF